MSIRIRPGGAQSGTAWPIAMAVVSLALASFVLRGQQPAYAATIGPLAPTSQGTYASWNPVNTGSQVSAVNQSSCGAGDETWITPMYRQATSFNVSLASLGNWLNLTAIELFVCYADNDTADLGTQLIKPLIRLGGSEYEGDAISADGNTSPRTAVHALPVDIFPSTNLSLEVGVRDYSFIHEPTRVYALWVRLNYTAIPTPTVQTSHFGLNGASAPYGTGEGINLRVTADAHPRFTAGTVVVELGFPPGQFGLQPLNLAPCNVAGPTVTCSVPPPAQWPLVLDIRLISLRSGGGCSPPITMETTFSGLITLVGGATVPLDGEGCGPPASPSASSSATQAPSTPPATSLPSNTATPATSLPSNTPTETVKPSQSQPLPTSTPTKAPTPGGGPSQLPHKLRAPLLANDGSH